MTSAQRDSLFLVLVQRAIQRPLWVVAPLILCGALGLFVGFRKSAGYVSQSSLRPNTSSLPLGSLSGIASQFGLNLAAGSQTEPATYFVRVLKSRDLLRSLATSEYSIVDSSHTPAERHGDLIALLDIEDKRREDAILRAVRRLDAMVAVRLDVPSGIITLRVSADHPDLAAQLNRRTLELLNTFNGERRRTRARAEREFVSERVNEAARLLDSAEQRLQHFLEQNRDYRAAPRLQFEADRFQRAVTLRQQVLSSALQALEQARVEEVRDTPVITIIDGPSSWVLPNGGLVLMTGLGIVVGGLVALIVVAAMPMLDRLREDLRQVFGLLSRRRDSSPSPS